MKSILRRFVGKSKTTCTIIILVYMVSSVSLGQHKEKAQEARDSIVVQADAVAIPAVPPSKLELKNNIRWSELYDSWKIGNIPNLPACVTKHTDKDQAYIFHIAHWSAMGSGKPPRLVSSSWSAYAVRKRDPDVLKRRLAANGDPFIYGKKRLLLIGANVFDNAKNGASLLTIRYKSSVKQGTPENVQSLSELATSLLGLSTAAKGAQGALLVAFDCQQGTDHLPFDFSVVETIGLPTSEDNETAPGSSKTAEPTDVPLPADSVEANANAHQVHGSTVSENVSNSSPSASEEGGNKRRGAAQESGANDSTSQQTNKSPQTTSQSGQADCSGLSSKNSCTINRTMTSVDKEWWDVSLAVSIPGVKETKYSMSKNTLVSKPTTHTDLYAMFDVYPGFSRVPKSGGAPHFTFGLPVAGQTFYRPEFGVAENITGWTSLERLGFPVRMSIFAGLVYMKITTVHGIPTSSAELAADSSTKRVLKPVFGIEVPVSALIGKVGKNNKSNSTNAQTSSKGKGTNQGSTVSTP